MPRTISVAAIQTSYGDDLQANNPASVEGPTFVPGRFREGLDFAFEGAQVVVTNSPSLDVGLADGLTLDAWVNPAALTTNRVLAAWSDGTNQLGVEFGFRPGVLTNVPGPRAEMTFAGAPVRQVVGFAPCSGDQPMTATIFSYNDEVTVGFASDADLVPDPLELAELVVAQIAVLAEATAQATMGGSSADGSTSTGR